MSTADFSDIGDATEPHVLVVAPFRSDAAVLGEVLRHEGIAVVESAGDEQFASQLTCCSALVMSQEAMTPTALSAVARHLEGQPQWSELPLILLVDEANPKSAIVAQLRRRLPHSKMIILQRPVRAIEFLTAAQSALMSRRRQLQLRDHIEWQQELQRELNHRVKNILANVVAIFHMTLRQSGDLDAFADSFEGRLMALSRVHSALVAAAGSRPLGDIAEMVLAPYRSSDAARVAIEGPTIELPSETAVTFALCLHELATNAAKYGAFSTPDGSVSLSWRLEQAEGRTSVEVFWVEHGGPPVVPPTRDGYGTKFVRSAMRGGGGAADIQYPAGGLTCAFLIPPAKLAG